MQRECGESFLVGLFVGAALGAMGAVLLTPRTGRQVRRELAREGRKIQDAATDLMEQGADAYERAIEAVQDTADEVKRAAKRVTKR